MSDVISEAVEASVDVVKDVEAGLASPGSVLDRCLAVAKALASDADLLAQVEALLASAGVKL